MEQLRHKDARPMMDLVAKKIFNDPEITAEFIRDIFELPVESVKYWMVHRYMQQLVSFYLITQHK